MGLGGRTLIGAVKPFRKGHGSALTFRKGHGSALTPGSLRGELSSTARLIPEGNRPAFQRTSKCDVGDNDNRGRAMSQPASQINPPGKPVRIMHRPIKIDIANAPSAGIPNEPRATTSAASRTPQPASDTGNSWVSATSRPYRRRLTGWLYSGVTISGVGRPMPKRPRRFLGNLAHRTILRKIDHAVLAGITHPRAEDDRSRDPLRRWLDCVDKVVTIKTDTRQILGGFETRIALLYDVSNGQERVGPSAGGRFCSEKRYLPAAGSCSRSPRLHETGTSRDWRIVI